MLTYFNNLKAQILKAIYIYILGMGYGVRAMRLAQNISLNIPWSGVFSDTSQHNKTVIIATDRTIFALTIHFTASTAKLFLTTNLTARFPSKIK